MKRECLGKAAMAVYRELVKSGSLNNEVPHGTVMASIRRGIEGVQFEAADGNDDCGKTEQLNIVKARKKLYSLFSDLSEGNMNPARMNQATTAMSLYKTLEKAYAVTLVVAVVGVLLHKFFKSKVDCLK